MSDRTAEDVETVAHEWRQRLKEADGEKSLYYEDEFGHQYLTWHEGEIVRVTFPDGMDGGNGPYGTDRGLFKRMMNDGDVELVPTDETPFGGASSDD